MTGDRSALNDLTIASASRALREKQFSSVELVTWALDRLDETEGELNAYITHDRQRALLEARRADKALTSGDPPPLTGIPLAIKDTILAKGYRATAGSKILEHYDAPYDATAVETIATDFEAGYSMKNVFAAVAAYCTAE